MLQRQEPPFPEAPNHPCQLRASLYPFLGGIFLGAPPWLIGSIWAEVMISGLWE